MQKTNPQTSQAETIHYDERKACFECLHCFEVVAIPPRVIKNPEKFLEMRELTTLDHSECSRYSSVVEAQMAREHRKESKRRELQTRRIV